MKKRHPTWAALLAAAMAAPAAAQGLRPASFFGQIGLAEHGTNSATAGVAWPWSWRTQLAGAELGGQTEAYVSLWNADDFGGGRQSFVQLGVVPVFRLRFDGGRSNWFLEGGIGITWMNRRYRTPDTQFSTTGNFHDMLGVGYSFGAQREQELSLRLVHFSNASIKKPNPGIEFLQLRYGRRF